MSSLKTRVVATCAALALGTGLFGATGGPAEAASKTPHPLMSHSEYHKIKKGMSIKKVRSIVDSKGKVIYDWRSDGDRYIDITWASKNGYHAGYAMFKNGKIYAKTWWHGSRVEGKDWSY